MTTASRLAARRTAHHQPEEINMTNANLKLTLIAIAAGSVFLLTQPAHPGGPVIAEDAAEAAPVTRDRDALVPLLLFGLVVAGIVLGGSDSPCQGPGDEPDGGCE
jgi:hypothetical protein